MQQETQRSTGYAMHVLLRGGEDAECCADTGGRVPIRNTACPPDTLRRECLLSSHPSNRRYTYQLTSIFNATSYSLSTCSKGAVCRGHQRQIHGSTSRRLHYPVGCCRYTGSQKLTGPPVSTATLHRVTYTVQFQGLGIAEPIAGHLRQIPVAIRGPEIPARLVRDPAVRLRTWVPCRLSLGCRVLLERYFPQTLRGEAQSLSSLRLYVYRMILGCTCVVAGLF
ncbi:hypothetical protein VUR80DRAFT_7536 [Thermomyces stellatus]